MSNEPIVQGSLVTHNELPIMDQGRKNIVLDSQLLSAIMTCPRKANFRFNRNLVKSAGKSNALECGSYVHTILEWFHRAQMNGQSKQDSIAIGFKAGDEYVRGYHPDNKFVLDQDEVGIQNTPLTEAESSGYQTSIELAKRTMEEYFHHYLNDVWTIIDVEKVRGNLLYQDNDIRIIWKAKYDLVVDTNAGVHSVDHKTMKQRKDTMVLNNQFIGQCFLLRSRSVIINKIGFQKTLKANEKFTRAVISYTADQIDEWANEIVPYYARMWAAYNEANHFPPNFNSCQGQYGLCEYYEDVCRNDRGMREESLRIFFKQTKKWDVMNNTEGE